jgi:hypothetical protein
MLTKSIKVISFFLFASFTINAQQGDSLSAGKVDFKIGAFFNSYLHYYGRSDSLESSGFFPVGELWFDKSLYLTASPVFVTGKGRSGQYAGTVLVAGYRFGKENRSSWNLYAVKPIYKESSQLIQSALQWQFAGSGTWLNRILNITGGADVKISEQVDYGAQAGVDHIFRYELKGQSVVVVDPSFYVHAGTRQFSRTYYKESGFLFFPGVQQEVTEKVKRFDILSYEISVPVVFAKGKMQMIGSPSYVMPQNLAGERGRNKFYGLIGAKFNF